MLFSGFHGSNPLAHCTGIDMMATFVKEILPAPIANNACESLDFDPSARGQYYTGEVTDWFEEVMKQKSA